MLPFPATPLYSVDQDHTQENVGSMWNLSRITLMFLSFRTDGLWAHSVDPDQTAHGGAV